MSRDAANTCVTIFGFTQLGIEVENDHTQGSCTNHYTPKGN